MGGSTKIPVVVYEGEIVITWSSAHAYLSNACCRIALTLCLSPPLLRLAPCSSLPTTLCPLRQSQIMHRDIKPVSPPQTPSLNSILTQRMRVSGGPSEHPASPVLPVTAASVREWWMQCCPLHSARVFYPAVSRHPVIGTLLEGACRGPGRQQED